MANASPVPFQLAGKRIFVAGHNGMAGSAIVRRLRQERCEVLVAERRDLDLTRQEPTEVYFSSVQPDVVIMAAARVGGILANNSYPVEFLDENLAIELNCIRASHMAGVQKLLFLGSTCVYPKFVKQPMSEDQLLTGELEPTNQWYAIAKIAGIKLCEAYRRQYGSDFVSVMPTNLYGPGDNYHPEHSHVVAALIRRFHEAKVANASKVVIWGTGTPRREFLYVDDFADACVFILKNYSGLEFLNIGVGQDSNCGRRGWLPRRYYLRHLETRWHAAKARRRFTALSSGLESENDSPGKGLGKAYSDFLMNAVREK
jgi:GDP-L-fucose synthase